MQVAYTPKVYRQHRLSHLNVAHAVGLARELHGLGTYGENGPGFEWDYTLRTMVRTIGDPNYYFHLAMDGTGSYVGAVCGRVVPFYFSPKLMGVEDAWYVRAGTRYRASIAMSLMRSFVAWCMDEKQCVLVQTGDIASINPSAVDALYRHMGFKRFGSIYKFAREA